MWPVPWHWKHLSSSLDMVLTNDGGSKVDVSCWAAWSFSTSLMVSTRLCGPFSYTLVARVCAFFRPFRKILMVAVSLSNLHLLASHLNQWTYAARDSFSVCWMSIKPLMNVWMSELDIFKWRESLVPPKSFVKLKLPILMFSLVPLILPVLIWFYSHPSTLKRFQYLWANPLTVRNPVHLIWEYLATKNFLKMFSFDWYTKCQYTCLILLQWALKGGKVW